MQKPQTTGKHLKNTEETISKPPTKDHLRTKSAFFALFHNLPPVDHLPPSNQKPSERKPLEILQKKRLKLKKPHQTTLNLSQNLKENTTTWHHNNHKHANSIQITPPNPLKHLEQLRNHEENSTKDLRKVQTRTTTTPLLPPKKQTNRQLTVSRKTKPGLA